MTAISGLLNRAMMRGHFDDRVVRIGGRYVGEVFRQHVVDLLVAKLFGGLVGPRLADHAGQGRVVLDVGRHDEPHHLRRGQHRIRVSGRIGHKDSRQSVFGEDSRSVQCVRVNGYHREFLGHVFGVHISTLRSRSIIVCSLYVVRSRRVVPGNAQRRPGRRRLTMNAPMATQSGGALGTGARWANGDRPVTQFGADEPWVTTLRRNPPDHRDRTDGTDGGRQPADRQGGSADREPGDRRRVQRAGQCFADRQGCSGDRSAGPDGQPGEHM